MVFFLSGRLRQVLLYLVFYVFILGLERQRQIEDYEEVRGFDLSPVHPIEPVHPADQDFSQGGSSHRGEHSQSQRGDYSHSHRGGFETSHTEDTEMYQPVTQVVSLYSKTCLKRPLKN